MNEGNESAATVAAQTNQEPNQRQGVIRPSFALYHANVKGTGCAMRMNLHPAHDVVEGSVMMSLATQKTVGNRTGATPTYSTFDWENRITVKLGFGDLCSILQVLRGELESINDGKGLYHQSADYITRIVFRHLVTPITGYSLEVYRTSVRNQSAETAAHLFVNPSEALGLSVVFENALPYVCFGIPVVVPHDTTAYRERLRSSRAGNAA